MKKYHSLICSLVAFSLFVVSLPLPYWTVIMVAPSYPERNLSMRVYTHMYEGDIDEWAVVGNLVGVKVPPPIPEVVFSIVPVLIIGLAGLSLLAAFKKRWLKIAAIAPWVVLAALAAWTQYSLYLFGHDLDPTRPLRFVDPFTPPVIGVKKIGSLVTYHLPHVGGAVFVVAALLLFWAYWLNRKEGQYVAASKPA
jgi:hypothetical protein